MIRDWEAIPSGVTWKRPPLFAFRASRAAIEDRFGSPQHIALDSNGWGPFDAWTLRFACGLEVALWLLHWRPDGTGSPIADRHELANVHVLANRPEEKHILFHLQIEPTDLSTWEPSTLVAEPRVWRLLRQDDNGNTLEVARYASRCEAESIATTFEQKGHKQTYWVEQEAVTR